MGRHGGGVECGERSTGHVKEFSLYSETDINPLKDLHQLESSSTSLVWDGLVILKLIHIYFRIVQISK